MPRTPSRQGYRSGRVASGLCMSACTTLARRRRQAGNYWARRNELIRRGEAQRVARSKRPQVMDRVLPKSFPERPIDLPLQRQLNPSALRGRLHHEDYEKIILRIDKEEG